MRQAPLGSRTESSEAQSQRPARGPSSARRPGMDSRKASTTSFASTASPEFQTLSFATKLLAHSLNRPLPCRQQSYSPKRGHSMCC